LGEIDAESGGKRLVSCGGCTLCCTVMQVDMAPLDESPKPALSACRHCEDRGCSIYDRRPKACRAFQCMWLQTQEFPEGRRLPLSERPDRTGIVLEVIRKGHIVAYCRSPDAWRVDPARKRLMSFVSLGLTVTIKHGGDRMSLLERDGSATPLEYVGTDPLTNEKRYRRSKPA
jgi:hypothetical protein